jgi:hypothetical protein
MLKAKSCMYKFIKDTADEKYPRIKYCEEKRFSGITGLDTTHRCHDCGVLPGGYHHFGCDVEECPKCNGQLIGCNCSEANWDTVTNL